MRIATFKLAFCRAMIAIAQACTQAMRHGAHRRLNMIEALTAVRAERAKQHPRRRAPTKRVLANSVLGLCERVETMHEETRAALAAMQASLQAGVDEQMRQLRRDLMARTDGVAAVGSGTRTTGGVDGGGGGGGRS